LTRAGEAVGSGISDETGRIVFSPPTAGEYIIEVVRLGYETFRSPLLALVREGGVGLELLMRPQAIGLEGFDVVTETRGAELLERPGLSAAELPPRSAIDGPSPWPRGRRSASLPGPVISRLDGWHPRV